MRSIVWGFFYGPIGMCDPQVKEPPAIFRRRFGFGMVCYQPARALSVEKLSPKAVILIGLVTLPKPLVTPTTVLILRNCANTSCAGAWVSIGKIPALCLNAAPSLWPLESLEVRMVGSGEASDLVSRRVFVVIPPRVEYELTAFGEEVIETVMPLALDRR